MTMYAETMLIPAIPGLVKDFDISYSTSSWILATYLVSAAVMTPISGKLSDIYGKKKILLAIMIIYTASAVLGGFANSISFLLAVRALQGIGLSMFPIAFSMARDQFPRQKVAIGQGIISSMYASGAVIGLAVGSSIIQHYGWQATYYSLIPIAAILTIVIWRFIRTEDEYYNPIPLQERPQKQRIGTATSSVENTGLRNDNSNVVGSRDRRRERYGDNENKKKDDIRVVTENVRLDVKGAITLAFTITSFLLAITFMEPGSAPAAYTVILVAVFLAIGITSLVLFVLFEKRVKSPLLDLNLFLNKTMLQTNILIFTLGFSMFTVFQTIPVLVENPKPVGFGGSAVSAAMVQLPFAIILLVFGPTSGFIISKIGSRIPIIAGTFVSTLGFFLLYLLHSTELLVSAGLATLAVGISLTNVGAVNIVILSTPRQNSGISLGMTMLLRIIGSAIGPVVAAMFMDLYSYSAAINAITPQAATATIQANYPSAESYNLIYFTCVLLSLFSLGLAITLARKSPKCQNHLQKERGEMRGAIAEAIMREILSWPGVTSLPHGFGGVEFRVRDKEMGHLHGQNMVDLPLSPSTAAAALAASGNNSRYGNKLVEPPKELEGSKRDAEKSSSSSSSVLPLHDVYPESKWINYWIKNEKDVPQVISLFRLQYDRLTKARN
ncbi:MAG: MFS transporter [Nitrososphaera sp.]